MKSIIEKVRSDLINNSDEKTKASGERFFREEVKMLGVKSAVTQRIGKEIYKDIPNSDKRNIFMLCNELWKSGYMEESFIACNWSYYVKKEYDKSDFGIFEEWINNYVNNWASCDTLCNHSVGTIIEMYPDLLARLKSWARSENRWTKRGAAVSLIIPAKKGKFLDDIFEISDILLSDKDDMVQKGYGWMLKSASTVWQEQVFAYVVSKKSTMPRTALRYAIEKMPAELKKSAMLK
jgi:3-methyladenine DNA glycosylase AlkD